MDPLTLASVPHHPAPSSPPSLHPPPPAQQRPPSRAPSHSSQILAPQITEQKLRRALSLTRRSYGVAVPSASRAGEGEESESEGEGEGEGEGNMEWEWEGEQDEWEKMLQSKEDEKAEEKLKEVRALLQTLEQEQYGLPILSPRSLVEHLIAEPEVELNEETLRALLEVCEGEGVGVEARHDEKSYGRMAEVLRVGGLLPGKALELFRNLPLTSLDLSPPSTIISTTAESLSLTVFSLPHSFLSLTTLSLSHLPLTPPHIAPLRTLRLTSLSLSYTPLTLPSLALLVPLAPSLRKLSLRGCRGVGDECLPVLAVFGRLKEVDLMGTAVGVREVRRLVLKLGREGEGELRGVNPPACFPPPFPPTAIRDPSLLSRYTTPQLKHQLTLHTHAGMERDPALALKVKKETVEGMRARVKGVVEGRLDDERCKQVMSEERRKRAGRWP
ncbi:hypothetical protein BCR35DRAFT_329824 [Leucosporidium creatinivorum]|uniref:Uncharacterized protein n=1 Tax=Leucosporidium creatinivorum TaxID=106004 RepID=A0A1Y2FX04_9BASI|nr:hypothetical protein BCR35DRAFT_329824 [Leucosporidium creatinivorum]